MNFDGTILTLSAMTLLVGGFIGSLLLYVVQDGRRDRRYWSERFLLIGQSMTARLQRLDHRIEQHAVETRRDRRAYRETLVREGRIRQRWEARQEARWQRIEARWRRSDALWKKRMDRLDRESERRHADTQILIRMLLERFERDQGKGDDKAGGKSQA